MPYFYEKLAGLSIHPFLNKGTFNIPFRIDLIVTNVFKKFVRVLFYPFPQI